MEDSKREKHSKPYKKQKQEDLMGMGKGIAEGSSSSLREQRNLREKERRMKMKHLFSILSSLVSPTRRLPVPKLIDQATSYMIRLKEKVNYLNERKRTLILGGGEVENRCDQRSSLLPKLSIRSRDSTIEMNLVVDLNMKRVLLHELLRVFAEEGAQVMSANLQNLNGRTFCTVIAQAIVCRIGIDPSKIEKRVKDIISC